MTYETYELPDMPESYALLDADPVNDSPWPLPEPRKWEPAPSIWARIYEMIFGAESV